MKGKIHHILLAIIFLVSFFLRVYRTPQILRFYYDQGRDAQIINAIIHDRDLVLVGPTTGLSGVLRGPFFYYLLLPGYLIGKGSPIIAAIWLQLINLIGIYIFYLCGKELFGKKGGLVAAILIGFSYRYVDLSRWLSNPSPILTSVPLLLYGLIKIICHQREGVWWPIIALILGLNLQLEMASEIWFIPALFLFFIFHKQYFPKPKTLIISILLFFITFLPQIAFDIRHDGVLRNAIVNNLTSSQESSFSFVKTMFVGRIETYIESFSETLTPHNNWPLIFLLSISPFALIFNKRLRSLEVKLVFWLLLFPLIVLSFYTGNHGNFYSYYLIGLLPIFTLLASGIISTYLNPIFFLIPISFLIITFSISQWYLKNYLIVNPTNTGNITLGNQLLALDWIKDKVQNQPYNLEIYVPPVIPYAYDYLVDWYLPKQDQPSESTEKLLFTLYEEDNANPQNLVKWQDNINSLSREVQSATIGGIHISQRDRY